jgi:hypothetical protein
MSERLSALERSLRDGPPDEAGYVPRPFAPSSDLSVGAPTSGTALERVVPTVRPRGLVAFSLQPVVAVLVVIAIGVAGFTLLGRPDQQGVTVPASVATPGPRASPSPSPTPTPSPSPSPSPGGGSATSSIPVPVLAATFVSTRNGFSVQYPAGWTVTPATKSWVPDTIVPLGNPALDDLQGAGEARLLVASHRLAAGETEAQYLAAYAPVYQGSSTCSSADPSTWPRLPVGAQSGYLVAAACPVAADGAIASHDVEFDAYAFAGGRVYLIKFDGNVDRAYLDAILATMQLDPSSAIDPPPAP